jgi:hypothetical protein
MAEQSPLTSLRFEFAPKEQNIYNPRRKPGVLPLILVF